MTKRNLTKVKRLTDETRNEAANYETLSNARRRDKSEVGKRKKQTIEELDSHIICL